MCKATDSESSKGTTNMVDSNTPSYEYWIAALQHILLNKEFTDNEGKVSQKWLADQAGYSGVNYFNQCLHRRPKSDGKESRFSDKKRGLIEKALGYDHVSFINLGEQVASKLPITQKQTITGDGNIQTGGVVSGTIQGSSSHSGNPCDLRPDVYKLAKLMQLIESPIEIKRLTLKYEEAVKEYDL